LSLIVKYALIYFVLFLAAFASRGAQLPRLLSAEPSASRSRGFKAHYQKDRASRI